MFDRHLTPLEDDDLSLKTKLRKIFQQHAIVSAGSVQLLGLDAIRERLGARWPSVREKVHIFVQRIIRNLLSEHDAWFRYGDDDYIIVFSHLDKAAAQLTCGKLIEEINRSLLGDEDTSEIIIRTVVFDVDGRLAVEMAGLSELLEKAAQRQRLESDDDLLSIGIGEADHASDTFDQRLAELSAAVRGHTERRRPHVVFRAVWDVAKSVFSTYRCVPAQGNDEYHSVSGYDVLANPQDSDAIFALDCETLTKSLAIALELYENKFRYISCIPLHFESLANSKRRNDYLKLLQIIPRDMGPFIEFTIHGLPPGAPVVRLTEIKTFLTPHARLIIPMVGLEDRNFSAIAQAGLKLIGSRIPPTLSENDVIERMRSFALSARKNNLISYVGGVRSAAIFEAACRNGIRFLSGSYFGPDEDYPQHMRRCGSNEIRQRAEERMAHGGFGAH